MIVDSQDAYTFKTEILSEYRDLLSVKDLSKIFGVCMDTIYRELKACFKNSAFELTTERCHSERSEESKTLRCAQGDSACQQTLKHAKYIIYYIAYTYN